MNKFERGQQKRQMVLDLLHAKKTGMRPCDVGRSLGIAARSMSSVMQRMVDLGEVTRRGDEYFPRTETATPCLSNSEKQKIEFCPDVPRLPGSSVVHRLQDRPARPSSGQSGRSGPRMFTTLGGGFP